MKKYWWMAVMFAWCGALVASSAATEPLTEQPAPRPAPPGVEAAQALSTLTGVAISPLLGVSAVGTWKYFRTPPAQRARLPWFAQPWFWGPAMLIVFMVFIKDAFGPAMSVALKKPFDLAELFENKLSALIATGAFVPIIASIFHSVGEGSQLAAWGLAAIDLAPLGNLLVVPLAMAAFAIVFLAGHAVNVLILISPFATLDAVLKSFRLFLISTVAATSLVHPYVGAAWALIIVAVSCFIAGWSLRLTVFGSVFAWDLVTFRHRRFKPASPVLRVFTARRIERTPVRTYGELSRDEQGRLALRYRPWLILPARTLILPGDGHFVGRGLFYPEIRPGVVEDGRGQVVLPPRYRTHEAEVAQLCGLGAVQDIGLRKGLKAVWNWLKGWFGLKAAPVLGRAPTVATV